VLKKNGTWYVPTLYVIEPILAEGNPLHVPEQSSTRRAPCAASCATRSRRRSPTT